MSSEILPRPGMEIIEMDVRYCDVCGNYSGWVIEDYNGGVEVTCGCDFDYYAREGKPLPNPGMICPDGTLWWRPISDHKAADGRSWHTPHFAGPPLHPDKRTA